MDPLANAMTEQEPTYNTTKDYFMECEVDYREVVFVETPEGWRLVDYDKGNPEHKTPDVEVIFNFYGTTRDGATYTKTYKMQTRSRKRPDWQKIVRPSLAALGVTDPSSQVHRKWVHFEAAKTGDTFVSKTTGETVERTAPRFLEIFESQEACEAAAEAFWSERRNGSDSGNTQANAQAKNVPQKIEEEHPQRAMFVTLLPAMWAAAQQQPDPIGAMHQMINANPLMKDAGISIDSEEVINLTGHIPY